MSETEIPTTPSGGSFDPWDHASSRPDAQVRDAEPAGEMHDPEDAQRLSYAEWASRWGADEPAGGAKSWIGLGALLAVVVLLGVFVNWVLVVAILALVLSVVLHEMGHYLVAKHSGMKVTEFFVGFGPRIWSFRRGETEYGIKAVWLGAYVRIIGMNNLEEVDPADEDRTYRSKSYPKRLAVVLAGPVMNILLGFFIFVAVFALFGKEDPTRWSVGNIAEKSAAAAADIQVGDRIVRVGDIDVSQFSDLRPALDNKAGTRQDLVVERNGTRIVVSVDLGWRLNAAAAAVLPGMQANDIPKKVGGQDAGTFSDFRAMLASADGPLTIEFERRGYILGNKIKGPVLVPADGAAGFIGVSRSDTTVRERLPIAQAIGQSAIALKEIVTGTGTAVTRMFSPSGLNNYANQVVDAVPGSGEHEFGQPWEIAKLPGSSAVGPAPTSTGNDDRLISVVGAIRIGSNYAETDAATGIFFLGLINISLGLLNLLPLLPFDGGHAAVATYEAIRSRKGRPYRVDMAKLLPPTYAVVGLLLLLGTTSIFLDIVRPISP